MLCVDDLKSSAFTVAFCSAYLARIAINEAVYGAEGIRLISLCLHKGSCLNQ